MSGEPASSGFYKPELHMGTVASNKTDIPSNGPPTDKRMVSNILPADNHAFPTQCPWILPPGLMRRPRVGMFAAFMYAAGHPEFGYVLGHSFNNDTTLAYADDYPAYNSIPKGAASWSSLIPQIDDLALYHDETGSFIRFRNLQSQLGATPGDPGTAGPDGSAGQLEVTMRSGATLSFEEYVLDDVPSQPPPSLSAPRTPPIPAPQRAKFTLAMPSKATLVIDEPEVGIATINLTVPNNQGVTTLIFDQEGNITLTAVGTVAIIAPRVVSGGGIP